MKRTVMSKSSINSLQERLEELRELLQKAKSDSSQEIQKQEEPTATGWKAVPNNPGMWNHPEHGHIHATTSAGKVNVVHTSPTGTKTTVGSWPEGPNSGQAAAEMTRRYMGSMGIAKSGYGPKGGSQYDPANNAKRKMGNTGDVAGEGSNVNVKAYSSKPGQLSAKQQAAKTPYKGAAGPVKQYTPEQIAAINEARKLKKNSEQKPWVGHAGVPNADAELSKLRKNNPVEKSENLMASQLANLMSGKAMLGAPPSQPTDQEMFGHLAVTEEVAKSADQQWNGAINNWLVEASKPISARFASEEEEVAYWASIKVTDRPPTDSGY